MKRSAVAFVIVCGVFAGLPGQAAAQGATWADRGYINIGWGVESGSSSMSSTKSGSVYEEPATITTTSDFTSGSLFDVAAGVRVFKNLTVGVGFHQEQNDTDGVVTGQIPSPVFFNRPRALSGTESLDRKEMATHVNIGWVFPINDKLDVMAYAGPSFFRLNQDVISDVQPNESGATSTTIPATISTGERKKSVTGYNVGVDATYIVWSNDSVRIGAGGFLRFTQASTEVEMIGSTEPTDVGGMQFGFGARIRF